MSWIMFIVHKHMSYGYVDCVLQNYVAKSPMDRLRQLDQIEITILHKKSYT